MGNAPPSRSHVSATAAVHHDAAPVAAPAVAHHAHPPTPRAAVEGVEGLVGVVEARVRVLRAALSPAGVVRVRCIANRARAVEAEVAVDAWFAQLEEHKRGEQQRVRVARKVAHQALGDWRVVVAVLRAALLRHQLAVRGAEHEFAHQVWLAWRSRLSCGLRSVVFTGPAPLRCTLRILSDAWWDVEASTARTLLAIPVPTCYHASAVSSLNHAFMVGGQAQTGFLRSCVRLDPSSGEWGGSRLPMPTARRQCGACVVGDWLVVVGGQNEDGATAAVEAMSLRDGSWRSLPALPRKTVACVVVGVGDRVFVAGGGDGVSFTKRVWALRVNDQVQPGTRGAPWRWDPLPPMSTPRFYAGGTNAHGTVVVCGGLSESYLSTCEAFDTTTAQAGAWTALPPMPERLSQVGCCFGGGHVFVVGGWNGQTQSHVLAFAVRDRAWKRLTRLATPRRGCTAVCVKGKRGIFVLGGHEGNRRSPSGELHVY